MLVQELLSVLIACYLCCIDQLRFYITPLICRLFLGQLQAFMCLLFIPHPSDILATFQGEALVPAQIPQLTSPPAGTHLIRYSSFEAPDVHTVFVFVLAR